MNRRHPSRTVADDRSTTREGAQMFRRTYLNSMMAAVAVAAIFGPATAVASPVDPPSAQVSVSAPESQTADATPLGALRGAGGVNDTTTLAAVKPVQTPAGGPATDSNRGFDWGDATIGAAGTLALLGVGGGVLFLSRRAGRQPAGA
jgi:hypothetical protein